MNHWRKFKKSRWYIFNYFLISFIVMSMVVWGLYQLIGIESYKNFAFDYRGIFLLPLGLILAVQFPVIVHNCVHGNFRIKALNTIIGELSGVYILLGLAAFSLNHRMHHVHSDTNMDPHNPHNKNFFKFFFANNFGGTEPVLKRYLQFHGDTKVNRAIFFAGAFLHFSCVPVRLAIWMIVLGPSLFITFFIPSYLFHMFVFAHVNYYTHETFENGDSVVYNMDEGIYYKFVNFFGHGVYYHKNHHENPNHYNPKLGASSSWLVR